MVEAEDISRYDQLLALIRVVKYRPALTLGITIGGVFAAILEGVGLGFILPIVEIVQSTGDPTQQADGLMLLFIQAYQIVGVPLSLGTVIIGVTLILSIRWTLTFLMRWLRSALSIDYTRELQTRAFDNALDAKIEYFDTEGSDDILNAIVTQAEYAGRSIRFMVNLMEQAFLALMYLAVAFVLSPALTAFAVVFLGGFAVVFRKLVDAGYDLGDRVADANERIQQTAQAGMQGIRDTKLFGLRAELLDDFLHSVDEYAKTMITLRRNEQAINSFYNLLTAVSVFVLIFLALTFAEMSLGALGVFLFAMFRLGPKASAINSQFYSVENNLPHLVRTQSFIDELERNIESQSATERMPKEIEKVEFKDVEFSYDGQPGKALRGVSFEFEKGEFIGFVGQSGAGKSTIVALLTRMYDPDYGDIRANGMSVHKMDIDEWRSRIAVVRQNPFIFNDTLRYNLTIGNRDVSQTILDEVLRIAKVDEFFDDLPKGYDTQLGDDGVRLSGGQRQRVALARALLKDADVLVLDEATSDLDSSLEKEVQESMETMERDYAVIGIAHRLSTLKNADRIYSVHDGEIVEAGSHEELLANKGKYSELYNSQSSVK